MKKRTLMAIFAALTIGATMAATSCDMLAGIPGLEGLFGSSVEEVLSHAVTWNYDSELVTVTPVGADALPEELLEGEEFFFTVTAKNGYSIGTVSGAKLQDDGSYKLTMPKRDQKVTINVSKTLNDLVVTAPEGLTYFEGQMVDTSVLTVTAKYALGDEVVTDYTISYTNGTSFALGDTEFTVSFGGKNVIVTLAAPVTASQEFYDAELVVENDVVYLVAKGRYNAAGTIEEAEATVAKWFNNCTERGSWAGMEYTVDVEMGADKFFTIKLRVEGMTAGRQYYFHIKEGSDGQDFTCAFKEGVVPVAGTSNNDDYTIEFPEEGEATYVETSDGTKYYIGTIPNWGSKALIICPINDAAPQFTGVALEVVEGKPYVVINGTCKAGLEADAAEALVLNLIKHFDLEDIKNGNAKLNGADYINGSAIVMQGEEIDEEGNVTVEGQAKAYITYDAANGTFKVYALLEGTGIVDGAAFFGHYGSQNSSGYYTNMGFAPDADNSSITVNGYTFAFATASELGLTEEWQQGITYISVTVAQ